MLQRAMPDHYEADFIIYNSGDSFELGEQLKGIQNLTVLDGKSCIFWASGIRLALDKYFENNSGCECEVAFIFFNDDVRFDLPNLKLWIQTALLNLDGNIATGSVCVEDSGQITYSGFRKTFTRFHKIKNYSELRVVDAINFNLAMFPGPFIRQNYKNTFNFVHGYADLYTSNYFLKKGGSIEIYKLPVGLCAQNNYHDMYNLSNIFKKALFDLYSDPKYYLISDAKKFSDLFGVLKYYVFFRSFVGVFVRWVISHVFNFCNKVIEVLKDK